MLDVNTVYYVVYPLRAFVLDNKYITKIHFYFVYFHKTSESIANVHGRQNIYVAWPCWTEVDPREFAFTNYTMKYDNSFVWLYFH